MYICICIPILHLHTRIHLPGVGPASRRVPNGVQEISYASHIHITLTHTHINIYMYTYTYILTHIHTRTNIYRVPDLLIYKNPVVRKEFRIYHIII